MVMQRRWDDAWKHRLEARIANVTHKNPDFVPAADAPDHEQTRLLLMEKMLRAARHFKSIQQHHLRQQAALLEGKASAELVEQTRKQASFAKRELFSAVMRLDAFDSQSPERE